MSTVDVSMDVNRCQHRCTVSTDISTDARSRYSVINKKIYILLTVQFKIYSQFFSRTFQIIPKVADFIRDFNFDFLAPRYSPRFQLMGTYRPQAYPITSLLNKQDFDCHQNTIWKNAEIAGTAFIRPQWSH